jgi:hypothetical protein
MLFIGTDDISNSLGRHGHPLVSAARAEPDVAFPCVAAGFDEDPSRSDDD